MININDFVKIGTFGKPHGIKGEISFNFTNDIFDRSECEYIVCLIDEIPVPFFIDTYRFKGSQTAIFKLEGIDTDTEAKEMTGLDIYFPASGMNMEEEMFSMSYFIGFSIVDDLYGEIGTIIEVDESTVNTLFVLDGEVLIPVNPDLIMGIDHDEKIIKMMIPEGLLE